MIIAILLILLIKQHHQIMVTIINKILKFKTVIKKPILANYAFFTVITFSNINPFAYISSIVIQHLQNPFI